MRGHNTCSPTELPQPPHARETNSARAAVAYMRDLGVPFFLFLCLLFLAPCLSLMPVVHIATQHMWRHNVRNSTAVNGQTNKLRASPAAADDGVGRGPPPNGLELAHSSQSPRADHPTEVPCDMAPSFDLRGTPMSIGLQNVVWCPVRPMGPLTKAYNGCAVPPTRPLQ